MNARDRDEEDDRFTASLPGLAMALLLAIIALFLIDRLATVSKLEDCLLQGRKNCKPHRYVGGPARLSATGTAWPKVCRLGPRQAADMMR